MNSQAVSTHAAPSTLHAPPSFSTCLISPVSSLPCLISALSHLSRVSSLPCLISPAFRLIFCQSVSCPLSYFRFSLQSEAQFRLPTHGPKLKRQCLAFMRSCHACSSFSVLVINQKHRIKRQASEQEE